MQCGLNDARVCGVDVAERLSNHTLSSDAEEHELERRKNLPVCYRTHATHMGRRQVATKKLTSGQKAQTRKRRRNAAATHKRPAITVQATTTGKKRVNLTAAATTQADLSRHALELKLSHPAPPHPGSGPAASKGKKSKEREKPLRIGASKGEVGRVSQKRGRSRRHAKTVVTANGTLPDVRFGSKADHAAAVGCLLSANSRHGVHGFTSPLLDVAVP